MVIKCCGYEGFESGGKVTQAAGVSKQTLLKLIEVLRRSCLLGGLCCSLVLSCVSVTG